MGNAPIASSNMKMTVKQRHRDSIKGDWVEDDRV